MQGHRVHSGGRRFLKRLGFSLFQAALFGGLLGLLVYLRPPHLTAPSDDVPSYMPSGIAGAAQAWLEGWELRGYDWRARELGERSTRSDDVVVVAIDDETLAEARQDDRPGIAVQPWPRQIVGGLVDRMAQEKASLILVDMPFPDLSPNVCLDPRVAAKAGASDDSSFRELMDRTPGRTLLSYGWEARGSRVMPPASRLWPFRVRLGSYGTTAEARARARSVLAAQRPAFIIPAGSQTEVWVGATDESDGHGLAERLAAGPNAPLQERRASDDAYRVGPTELFVSLAEVQVEGLDASKLLEVRQLQHPVAPLLGGDGDFGAVTLPADPDGIVRGVPHLVVYSTRGERHVLPSLPLAAAMRLAGTRKLRYEQGRLFVGDQYSVPMDVSGFSMVRWDAPSAGRGSRGSLARSVRAWNVLLNVSDVASERPPRFDNDLEGRVALLTRNVAGDADARATPIGLETPGGAILGQALANLLRSDGITRATPDIDLAATVGLAFFGAFMALSLSWLLRSVGGAILYVGALGVLGAGYSVGVAYLFVRDGLWVAMAGPLLAMAGAFLTTTVYAFRTDQEVRDFVQGALGRYVSPEVARLVTRDLSLMRPERRQMSVYVCDIEGFTRMSAGLSPEQLVDLFNEYLTELAAVVRSTAGQVDKYLGDSVMAFWGAPVRTDRHAHLACEAALKIRAAVEGRQAAWEKKYGRRLGFRAAIDTGEVVVGDMGSELKSNYTVLGDAVSLAARLESINKVYGTHVLVGDTTMKLASDKYQFRVVDRVRFKGRPEPVLAHELMGHRGEGGAKMQQQLALYEQAQTAYHQRRFDEALSLFERGAAEFSDPVCAVYVGRCRAYLVSPPPEGWDGVHGIEDTSTSAAA